MAAGATSSGAGGSARYTISLGADGIITIRIIGFWSTAEVDGFFAALKPVHDLARTRYGRVLVLVEVGSLQSPAVALHVRDRALAIKRPGDRTALLVATILSKLQITRLGSGEQTGVFTDAATARSWLLGPA